LRVLHLASGTDYGGAKTHIFTLLSELTKRIEVTLGSFTEGPFSDEARDLGLDVYSFRQASRYDLLALGRLENLVRERGYDIIHSHGPRSNLFTVLARRRLQRPLVTTVHSDYRKDFAGDPLKNVIFTRLSGWALRRFDRYLVVGAEDSILRLGVPASLITPLRNGIVFDDPVPPPREKVLAPLGVPTRPGEIVVGIVARLHPVKCHEIFLAGAAKVAVHHPNVRFLIVGDGRLRHTLERAAARLGIADRVHFLGHIEDPDGIVSVLDVNALTSFSEALPYALLEGARWRKATLSSRVGAIPDLIIDGETGYLFEPGDVDGFARRLKELVADPALRSRLGSNLYEHGVRNFTPAVMADTCLAVYRELVDRRRPSNDVR